MKTYLRLLGFASPLGRYAIPYFFYSVLHALFNTFTYTMIIPIIGTLFSDGYVFTPVYEFPQITLDVECLNQVLTTAFCGPITFIGLSVPHIARLLLRSSNHNTLLPVTMLCGAIVLLLCNIISVLPGTNGIIPINAVTPLIGAPVIIYVIVNQKKINYFNG